MALAFWAVPSEAQSTQSEVATIPAGPSAAWWTRKIKFNPRGTAVEKLRLETINAALEKRGSDREDGPLCAIQPVAWSDFVSDDKATQELVREATSRYPGAFRATMLTRPGRAVDVRIVAYRRCNASDEPGLAILTVSASGQFDDFGTVPWPFVRLRPVTTENVSLFDCLYCTTPVASVAPDDWIRHARWHPLQPLASTMSPPDWLGIDPFYTKFVEVDGIPILSSPKVADRALLVARTIIHDMLRHRPKLGRVLVMQGQRVALIADDEAITDLPQNRTWKKPAIDDPRLTYCERKQYDVRIGRLSDRDYWNGRARAAGGVFLADGAEDVLGERSSRWYGETILIHEFAHRLLDALQIADREDYDRVASAYKHAQATGLWTREYALTSLQEYWAEGTQFWFNSNKIAVFAGRRILSDGDLRSYDPLLYAALANVSGHRHQIADDPFYESPARVPKGTLPNNTAEQCLP